MAIFSPKVSRSSTSADGEIKIFAARTSQLLRYSRARQRRRVGRLSLLSSARIRGPRDHRGSLKIATSGARGPPALPRSAVDIVSGSFRPRRHRVSRSDPGALARACVRQRPPPYPLRPPPPPDDDEGDEKNEDGLCSSCVDFESITNFSPSLSLSPSLARSFAISSRAPASLSAAPRGSPKLETKRCH